MARRTYNDPCDLARALDVLGGRWALLVIRELLGGPRRFSQLRAALPGVATNILAARLKELEAHAVIQRSQAPSDGRGHAYELTPLGGRVGPVVEALASWARALPQRETPGDSHPGRIGLHR